MLLKETELKQNAAAYAEQQKNISSVAPQIFLNRKKEIFLIMNWQPAGRHIIVGKVQKVSTNYSSPLKPMQLKQE